MKLSKHKKSKEEKQFLAKLKSLYPIAKGSLAEVYKPCIRPGCPACASGEKHRSYIFSFKDKGRRRCMYVPVDLVPILRKAIDNGRLLEERMSALGAELIVQFRQQRDKPEIRKKKKLKKRS